MNERIQAVLEAVQELNNNTTQIKTYIPNQASAANQLADKAFVNSSINLASPNYKGTFTELSELQATSGTDNDYTFYKHTDSTGNTVLERYKYIGSPEPRLPDEYQEVENIKGTRSVYIDTGINIEPNMHIKMKFKSSSFGGYGTFSPFGAKAGGRMYGIEHNQFSGKLSILKGGGGQKIPEITSTDYMEIEILSSGAVLYNGNFVFNIIEENIEDFADLSLFMNAMNNQSDPDNAVVEWNEFKIYTSDETPKAHYVPCYRKLDYVAGVYDLVTETFKSSDGTGVFNFTLLSTDKWAYNGFTFDSNSFTTEQWAAINSGVSESVLQSKQNVTDNSLATTNKNIPSAINEVNSIAKGANQALSYRSYQTMITALNAMDGTEFKVGQNVYIMTVDVPDLWVSAIEEIEIPYTYVDDDTVIDDLNSDNYIQCGHYCLSMLETQKVDLTQYMTKTELENSLNKPLTNGNKIATMLDVSGAKQIQVVLPYADWYETPEHWQIDVTATGVTANNAVVVSPAPSSAIDYNDTQIMAIFQNINMLSFSATRQPTDNITVNVLIMEAV